MPLGVAHGLGPHHFDVGRDFFVKHLGQKMGIRRITFYQNYLQWTFDHLPILFC
jgi:hypothetical protein